VWEKNQRGKQKKEEVGTTKGEKFPEKGVAVGGGPPPTKKTRSQKGESCRHNRRMILRECCHWNLPETT